MTKVRLKKTACDCCGQATRRLLAARRRHDRAPCPSYSGGRVALCEGCLGRSDGVWNLWWEVDRDAPPPRSVHLVPIEKEYT
jgi:hypothetical protein